MADTMEQIKEVYNPATVYPALSNDPDSNNSKKREFNFEVRHSPMPPDGTLRIP